MGESAAITTHAEPDGTPRAGRTRRFRHRRSTVLGAVVAAVSLAGAAVALAADGLWSVGTTISGDESAAPGHPPTGVPERVLATGSSPIAGPWRISAFASQTIATNGEIAQPEGLPCVKLLLLDPPPGSPLVGSSQCGLPRDDLEVMSLPVRDGASRDVEIILWGRVTAGTAAIELSAEGARPTRVAPEPGPADHAGAVWAIAASPDLEQPTVSRLDNEQRRIGPPVDATSDMARAKAFSK